MGRFLLLFHLIGVIAWLGPSVGAWLMVLQARREGHGIRALEWFERIVRLEHAGLALLLVTGVGMLVFYGLWPPRSWLLWKLGLVVLIVVPIEIGDLYLSHLWLPRALKGPEPEGVATHYERWLWRAGVPLLLTAFAILLLAVFKPAL